MRKRLIWARLVEDELGLAEVVVLLVRILRLFAGKPCDWPEQLEPCNFCSLIACEGDDGRILVYKWPPSLDTVGRAASVGRESWLVVAGAVALAAFASVDASLVAVVAVERSSKKVFVVGKDQLEGKRVPGRVVLLVVVAAAAQDKGRQMTRPVEESAAHQS